MSAAPGRQRGSLLAADPGLLLGALPRLGDHALGLIAEFGGDLPVRGQYLGRGENLFLVAGVVGCDLRRLRPAEAAAGNSLLDLLAAWAGSVEIILAYSLLFPALRSCRTRSHSRVAEPEHKFGLINSGCILLGIEEARSCKARRGAISRSVILKMTAWVWSCGAA